MVTRKDIIELMKQRYSLPAGKDRPAAYAALTKKIDAAQRKLDRQKST